MTIILKVDFNGTFKRFDFLDKDEDWAFKQKRFYESQGCPVDLIYENQKSKLIPIDRVFKILHQIIDEGNEHASQILPKLRKRLR